MEIQTRLHEAERLQAHLRDGRGRRTLPELVIEAWLRRRGIRHEGRANVVGLVADFLVERPGADGWMVWQVRDVNPASLGQLWGATVQGRVIERVVALYEQDVLLGDLCLEQALNGVELR